MITAPAFNLEKGPTVETPEAPANSAPSIAELTVIKDKNGTVFDASRHAADDQGRPRFDSKGRFFSNRLGRKTTKPQAEATAANPPPIEKPDFSDIDRAARAPEEVSAATQKDDAASGVPTVETCIGVIQCALVLIGSEEGVLSDTEKLLLRPPLKRVLDKYNVGADVLPAEVELAFAVASLLISRLQKPKTATWFAKAKAWVFSKWFGWKGHQLANTVRREVSAA